MPQLGRLENLARDEVRGQVRDLGGGGHVRHQVRESG